MSAEATATARGEQAFIGGAWVPARSGETYEKRSPIAPTTVLASIPMLGEQDVDAALRAADEAFPAWAALPPLARARYLEAAADAVEERAERIARDMSAEMGKPIRDSRGEALRTATAFRTIAALANQPVGEQYTGATGAQILTARRPLGVVGVIAPWNFPLMIPSWKVASALVAGNSVVLKVAFETPLSGIHLAACLDEAGLPAGVFNLLTGRGSVIGAAVVKDPRVRAISFTGSVPTGAWIRDEATRAGKKVQLELGGQNPLVVMDDADLDRAVEAAYWGAFGVAGQKCTGTRRIYVQEGVYDAFRGRFLARVEHTRTGDPFDEDVEFGPLASQSQFDDIAAAIDRAVAEGGTLLVGGAAGDERGYFVPPTVFENVADEAFLSCEEVFGPVVTLYRFGDLDDAIGRANATRFGLTASIYTTNASTALRFQREAQAGAIYVNSPTPGGLELHVPFGGLKESGFGVKELGPTALEFFSDRVTVYVAP
jgi:acyl-CoA reductase-like NAD-dependent aldehyde dehydrogenase